MFVRVGPHLRVEAEISVPSYLFVSLCSVVHGLGVAYQCLFGDSHHNRRAKNYTRGFQHSLYFEESSPNRYAAGRGSQHVVHVLVQLSCASAGGFSFFAYPRPTPHCPRPPPAFFFPFHPPPQLPPQLPHLPPP